MKLKQWGAFGLLALSWGSSYFWIKIALRDVDALTLVACRVLFGILGLLAIMALTGQRFPRERTIYVKTTILGILSVALPFFLLTWGETNIDSGLTGVLNSTVPFFTIILAHFFLADEAVTAARVAGLITGFLGVMTLVSRGGDGHAVVTGTTPLLQIAGAGAVVAASLSYASGAIYTRRQVSGMHPVVQSAMVMISGGAILWAAVFIKNAGAPPMPTLPVTWLALAWLGLIGSCLAYVLYFYLLKQWGATRVSLVMYVCPVIAVLIGVAFLGETIDSRFLLGATLVLCGLVTANFSALRTRKFSFSLRRRHLGAAYQERATTEARLTTLRVATAQIQHEIRNLTLVVGMALSDETRDPELQAAGKDAAARLKIFVDDMARFSESLQVKIATVDAAALLRETVAGASLKITGSASGSLWVKADAATLSHVIGSLISAARARTSDQGTITVMASSDGRGKTVIAVSDSGKFLTFNVQEFLFKPFARLGRSPDGSVELWQLAQIVAAFGGQLTVLQPKSGVETTVVEVALTATSAPASEA